MFDFAYSSPIPFIPRYRIDINGNVWDTKRNKLLSQWLWRQSYAYVELERRSFRVNRLVAEVFVDNPDDLPNVDHIDRNTLNNNAFNLRWCTQSDNAGNAKARDILRKRGILPKNVYESSYGSGYFAQLGYKYKRYRSHTVA